MLPISDVSVYQRRKPYVNLALIALNAIVFVYTVALSDLDVFRFNYRYGVVPAELAGGRVLDVLRLLTPGGPVDVDITSPIGAWGTVFTSMFMHGGWMHFIGNMLFLWVFGDNVEERLGHIKYLMFYLGCGIVAVWAHVFTDVDSTVPLIGASGAISGVLGAYLLLYPYNRITTLVLMFFITVIQVPAILLLGFWFILQLFQGVGSLGPGSSGVAYMAHVGGFLAGMLAMGLYKLAVGERLWPEGRWGVGRF